MTGQHITVTPEACLRANPEGIPDALKEYAHWVVWSAVSKGDGKLDKIPHDPRTGRRASTTDSRTWRPFLEALEAYQEHGYDGLGFVLSSGDPYVAIDFDNCRNRETGEVAERVLELISRFESCYVEVSPSGTGLHLITRGRLRDGTKKGDYEVYGQERFVTMTGEVFDA